jgi:hypothetical protein
MLAKIKSFTILRANNRTKNTQEKKNRLTKQQNCRVALVNDSFDFLQNKSHTQAFAG